ncbi:hypothetical protein ACSSS7_006978 [Eimeria intestinalis]
MLFGHRPPAFALSSAVRFGVATKAGKFSEEAAAAAATAATATAAAAVAAAVAAAAAAAEQRLLPPILPIHPRRPRPRALLVGPIHLPCSSRSRSSRSSSSSSGSSGIIISSRSSSNRVELLQYTAGPPHLGSQLTREAPSCLSSALWGRNLIRGPPPPFSFPLNPHSFLSSPLSFRCFQLPCLQWVESSSIRSRAGGPPAREAVDRLVEGGPRGPTGPTRGAHQEAPREPPRPKAASASQADFHRMW